MAIRDALLGVSVPFIELHVANIHAREDWRHHSYFSDKAKAIILQVRDDSFDRSYANNQVVAHEQTIEIFRTESQTSDDAELKAFAEKTLPTLEHHLQEAKALQTKYAK